MSSESVIGRRRFLGTAAGAAAAAALLFPTEEVFGVETEATPAAEVTLLGQPCRARLVAAGTLIEDAGREWFVITNMNENSRMELIFIDPETGEGEVHRAPAGDGSWALLPLTRNRLAVGTFYDGLFLIFDVPSRTWVKTVKFPGETYIWSLAEGKDGRIYGGTYPNGKLGALDVDTFAFEDLGAPGPPNKYLRWVAPLPDGRILCPAGFEKPEAFVFDPATKRFTPVPAGLNVGDSRAAAWDDFLILGNNVYRMPDLAPADPLPFPAPDPKRGAWTADPRLTSKKTLVLRQGQTVYRFRKGDAALTEWMTLPRRGVGALFAASEKSGALLGIRGQDFFAVRKGDRAVALRRIPGESAPRATMFLRADDRGRVWGGPTFGQTLFYLDTKTGKTVNTSTVSDHGGEVYDVAVIDGVCYAVAYVGGEVIRWDPAQPWDQVNHVNPKTIAKVGPAYVRPEAGVIVGPDGRLYSGWLAEYGKFGGALAATDPKTGKTEIIQDPLGPHGLSAVALAEGGRLALLGTTIAGNGLGEQKGASAAFGVWDLTAGKRLFSRTFDGAHSVPGIAADPKTGRAVVHIVTGDGGRLWLFDVERRAFAGNGPALPDPVNGGSLCADAARGRALYGSGNALRSYDFASGRAADLAMLPDPVSRIAVSPDGKIYASGGVNVFAVSEKGVEKA